MLRDRTALMGILLYVRCIALLWLEADGQADGLSCRRISCRLLNGGSSDPEVKQVDGMLITLVLDSCNVQFDSCQKVYCADTQLGRL